MQSIVCALLVSLMVARVEVFAQDSPVRSFGNNAFTHVVTHIESERTLRQSVALEATRLAQSRTTASLPSQQAAQRSWAGRHPVLLGALIGAGVGSAIAADSAIGCDDDSEWPGGCAGSVAYPVGVVAGIGATVGLVVAWIRR